jgi:CheY-like chemotaxis protein
MLIFARKQPAKLEAIDVNATLEGLLGFLRRACPENIAIVAEFAPDAGFASADPHQLQTALLNLVINARDAMPNGGTVRIATARAVPPANSGTLAPRDHVCITVADNGTGMPPEVLERAFEPFFTTKDIGKGTGLGLAMVYGALRQMLGGATIDSEPGRGTAVQLWLRPTAPPERHSADVERTEPLPPAVLGTELILVEDDAIVSMATAEILREAGYTVHEASRAERALQLLDRHPGVAALVTDVGLPGMDGHELALESRRRRPGLKVLFITGHDRSAGSERGQLGPDTEYLDKPYQPEALFAALRRLALGG